MFLTTVFAARVIFPPDYFPRQHYTVYFTLAISPISSIPLCRVFPPEYFSRKLEVCVTCINFVFAFDIPVIYFQFIIYFLICVFVI